MQETNQILIFFTIKKKNKIVSKYFLNEKQVHQISEYFSVYTIKKLQYKYLTLTSWKTYEKGSFNMPNNTNNNY